MKENVGYHTESEIYNPSWWLSPFNWTSVPAARQAAPAHLAWTRAR